jgi:hypothetical protein
MDSIEYCAHFMALTPVYTMPKVPFHAPRPPCFAKIVSNPPNRLFVGNQKRA